MYRIGDRIVYPMHGAGVIEDIREQTILGRSQQYYVLSASYGNMKLMIPVENAEEIGVRNIQGPEVIGPVFEVLRAPSEASGGNWNRRNRENLEKLKTGDLCKAAEVIRGLLRAEREKKLSGVEKDMLAKARHILLSELLLITDWSREEAEQKVTEAVFASAEEPAQTAD